MKNLIIVRGGGDLATGTIHKLVQSGFPVLVLETAMPSAIRRNVAFSEAVYEGSAVVEGVTARLAHSAAEAETILTQGNPAVLVDPDADCLRFFSPLVLVDAILAKKNMGTHPGMAPVTIALGPGFRAGVDVDVVIETRRGHNLGRLIYTGEAAPNTGVPGEICGYARERVVHAPAAGIFRPRKELTTAVRRGDLLAEVITADGPIPVYAAIDGLLRGLLRDGYPVTPGFKCADIDPRLEEYDNCFTISDKARCIAGGVLEAILQNLYLETVIPK